MSLIQYLKEKKIDQIQDDQKFMDEEYNAVKHIVKSADIQLLIKI